MQQQQCNKPEINHHLNNQHPILANNLMHNQTNLVNESLPVQNIIINNNLNNMNHLNHSTSNSLNSQIVTTTEQQQLTISSKSPYAQMSILEKNSNQMQQQSTNNLVQNNPILNNLIASNPIGNLIANNTISTNLVQNNFIQLNTGKIAKNISNGFINETIAVTNQTAGNHTQVQNSSNTNQTFIDSNNLNPSTYLLWELIFFFFQFQILKFAFY